MQKGTRSTVFCFYAPSRASEKRQMKEKRVTGKMCVFDEIGGTNARSTFYVCLNVLPQLAVDAVGLNLARGHILDLDDTLNRVKKSVRSNVDLPVVLCYWIVDTCPTCVAFAVGHKIRRYRVSRGVIIQVSEHLLLISLYVPFHSKPRVIAGALGTIADSLENRIGSVAQMKQWKVIPIDCRWHRKMKSLGCQAVARHLECHGRHSECQAKKGAEPSTKTMSCQPNLCARVHVLNCPQNELVENCLCWLIYLITRSAKKKTYPPTDSYHCVVVIDVIAIHAILDTSQVALVSTCVALTYASPGPVHFSTATGKQKIVLFVEKYSIR